MASGDLTRERKRFIREFAGKVGIDPSLAIQLSDPSLTDTKRQSIAQQSGLFGDQIQNVLQRLGTVTSAFKSVDEFNRIGERLKTPGLSEGKKAQLRTEQLRQSREGLTGIRNVADEFGLDFGTDLRALSQEFIDAGIQLREGEGPGGIDVTPPESLLPSVEEPAAPELPPEPPPLRDVLGQPPTATPGQPPIAIEPDLAQPGTPGLAPTPPPGVVGSQQAGVAQGGQTTIAVPDPRNPGQLIEIPVVDRGIPGDIERQADQFLLEREGLRQQEQQRQAFEAQRGLRSQRLGETSSLLEGIAGRQFREAIPQAAEVLQSQGLLQTSELENALAREQSRLTSGVQESIAAQSLQDRQAEISGIGEILSRRQAFQTAGLQREFSLEDFERAARVAVETGASVTPQVGGQSTAQQVLGGIGTLGAAASGAGGLLAGIGALRGGSGKGGS